MVMDRRVIDLDLLAPNEDVGLCHCGQEYVFTVGRDGRLCQRCHSDRSNPKKQHLVWQAAIRESAKARRARNVAKRRKRRIGEQWDGRGTVEGQEG